MSTLREEFARIRVAVNDCFSVLNAYGIPAPQNKTLANLYRSLQQIPAYQQSDLIYECLQALAEKGFEVSSDYFASPDLWTLNELIKSLPTEYGMFFGGQHRYVKIGVNDDYDGVRWWINEDPHVDEWDGSAVVEIYQRQGFSPEDPRYSDRSNYIDFWNGQIFAFIAREDYLISRVELYINDRIWGSDYDLPNQSTIASTLCDDYWVWEDSPVRLTIEDDLEYDAMDTPHVITIRADLNLDGQTPARGVREIFLQNQNDYYSHYNIIAVRISFFPNSNA